MFPLQHPILARSSHDVRPTTRRTLVVLSCLLGSLAECGNTSSLAANAPAPKPAPIFEELGNFTHPISTSSREAQRYFDQGLMLLFNFNHQEAIRSFRAAATLDPRAPMPHWGEAFAHGPHINAPMAAAAAAPAWPPSKSRRN